MSTPEFSLSVFYLRQIAEQIRSIGGDVEHWLAHSQLDEAQLADSSLQIPYAELRLLIGAALSSTKEPALGLLVGERLVANTHGILGYAAINSASLRQAVQLLAHYLRVRTSLVLLSHEIHGDQFRLVFIEPVPLGEIRRPVLEAVILTIKNLLDHIAMGSCNVSEVAFPFDAPDYAALAQDLFKCELRYGQAWAGIALPLNSIDLPLKMADPASFQDAVQICQRELDKLLKNESLSTQLRRIMLEKQGGFPSLNVMARLLHLTPRTLHRRLLQEQTSYKEIIEDVRHTLALEYLKSGQLSIQEIAYMLGYSDIANFRRAFKRWEQLAPSLYRIAHGAKPD
ncbi:AraC family transcriptional regulator [Undibacterium sp.]|uniref:AraC family transcriptional regulator n=1 Tax=Undibacterium sp. TaxID=1914977 RepID=UPI0025E8CC1A|nr:AraC family transcriptional regulator [Undibacterium sp.]